MDLYICLRCGHESKTKQALEKHLKKQKICIAVSDEFNIDRNVLISNIKKKITDNPIVCDICNKCFKSKPSMYRHRKHYCIKKSDDLQERVVFLEEMVKTLQSTPNQQLTIIQNQTNIHNQNIQIQINNFGNENIGYLSNDFLSDCVMQLQNGMKNLFQKIHFDPSIPQNHNIRYVSKKHNLLEKFSNGSWQLCDKNNTLDELIRKGYRILFQHFIENHLNKIDSQETIERNDHINMYFQKIMNKDSSVYYQLRRDLFIMVMNGTLYVLGKDDNI